MIRPQCRRCGGKLDLAYDPETERVEWHCNNPQPMMTDDLFYKRWEDLHGDDVVRLEKKLWEKDGCIS